MAKKKSIADVAAEIGVLREFTIQDAIALMPIEDIIKRETLINEGLYDFSTDIELAKYWRERSQGMAPPSEDPLRFHRHEEEPQAVAPTLNQGIVDISLEDGNLVFAMANGESKTIPIPEARVVDRIVSGNSVSRKPIQEFIREDCFSYSVNVGKDKPVSVSLYDALGSKCHPQITWNDTSIQITSNINLNGHTVLVGT